jgi:hypothetical protein
MSDTLLSITAALNKLYLKKAKLKNKEDRAKISKQIKVFNNKKWKLQNRSKYLLCKKKQKLQFDFSAVNSHGIIIVRNKGDYSLFHGLKGYFWYKKGQIDSRNPVIYERFGWVWDRQWATQFEDKVVAAFTINWYLNCTRKRYSKKVLSSHYLNPWLQEYHDNNKFTHIIS